MKPRDYPTGRTRPTEEEPFVIDMSIEPEEAGANARRPSPSPDYETVEVAEVLMDEEEAEKSMASMWHQDPGPPARILWRRVQCSMPTTPKTSDPGRLLSFQLSHR